ncbi:hypothetical protein EMN47_06605 [Prolixibacteraceae bacterium JC049]|nr:hypothetical protein [Prolixibacteraceae bacterium JC049]
MASVRQLKKDIEALTTQVASYCFEYMEVYREADREPVVGILKSAIELRNELIARANHPDGKDNPKLVKAHYKAIVNELLAKTDAHFDQIRDLLKQHAE